MQSLVDVQQQMRDAVVSGDASAIAPLLKAGGRDAARRLDIHRRHYVTSLVGAVMGRFPATAWLMGCPMVEASAFRFVRECPPTTPCIAEYGQAFPAFLSVQPGADRLPYVEAFADLDWHLGRLSVSVDLRCADPAGLAALHPDDLTDAVLAFQAGTYLAQADWPIDDLMKLYLCDVAPQQTTMAEGPVWFEARGARGTLRLTRLSEVAFVFRHALWRGTTIGAAAERAWQFDPGFDQGSALAALFDAQLVVGVLTGGQERAEP